MKFLIPLLFIGCAPSAKMTGTVLDDQMYFDRMVPVEVDNAPDATMWIKLNQRQLRHVKPGDQVIFYVKTDKVEYQTP